MSAIVISIVLLIVVLLIFSGFFSGSEIAFAKCNRQRLKKLSEEGNKAAVLARSINDNFSSTLSAILAGNEMVNIAASSAATILALTAAPQNHAAAQAVASAAMTFSLLIFGEIVPKLIFSRQADKMVLFAARPIALLTIIFKPLIIAVDKLVGVLSPLWKHSGGSAPAYTSDELSVMLDLCRENGQIKQEDCDILQRTIRFYDKTLKARDIMTSRVEVTAYCLDDGIEYLLDSSKGLLNKYSLIPVYKDSLDNIIGLLPTAAFKKAVIKNGISKIKKENSISGMLVSPVYVYEERKISDIYDLMVRQNTGMVIVLDEYGGMTGIITLEDIFEQIVGEIYDERDGKQRSDIVKYEEKENRITCVVRGGLYLSELFDRISEKYNYRLHNIESSQTTVGGWINETLGHAAVNGDRLDEDGISINVLKAEDGRVLLAELIIEPDD